LIERSGRPIHPYKKARMREFIETLTVNLLLHEHEMVLSSSKELGAL
jgi:hypothetical protein